MAVLLGKKNRELLYPPSPVVGQFPQLNSCQPPRLPGERCEVVLERRQHSPSSVLLQTLSLHQETDGIGLPGLSSGFIVRAKIRIPALWERVQIPKGLLGLMRDNRASRGLDSLGNIPDTCSTTGSSLSLFQTNTLISKLANDITFQMYCAYQHLPE